MGERSFNVCDRTDGFWERIGTGRWEPNTEAALSRLTRNDVFIDIGAWIGWTTLTAAAYGASVIAFEPDPISRVELERNIRANPGFDVTVLPVALSDKTESRQLTAPYVLGDSMGSIVRPSRARPGGRAVDVAVEDVRCWLPRFTAARLIKIDTEGSEYRIVPPMRQWLVAHKPDLMLSLHTSHLSGILKVLPKGSRGATHRIVAHAIRRKLRWLADVYPRCFVASETRIWEPVTKDVFNKKLDYPGEMEIYLTTRDWP